jgi:ABC-type antimicrobial peptide transport system permease subunit
MKLLAVILFVSFAVFQIAAQEASQKGKADEIPMLISKLASEDENTSSSAADALIKIGPGVIASLIESLKQTKYCDYQFLAVEVIRKIDNKQAIIKPVLFDVAGGKCEYRYPPEKYLPDANFGSVISQWYAAAVLATEIEGGITLVTELLKTEAGIYSAAYAFAQLVVMMERNRLEKIELKPEIISEIKAAIPMLVKKLDIEYERLRCDFDDIIQALQKSGYKELRLEANRALEGKKVNCPK